MPWNVLITARAFTEVGQAALEQLRRAGCETVFPPKFGGLPAAKLLPVLEGIDAALASADDYTEEVLASPAAARLKIISRWGVGYDSIDIAAATRLGILVSYTPGLLNEAVADYTFALLFALARRVHEGHLLMRQGEWKFCWGHDISGKTLGIVGCGRIGLAVARRACGFNLRVISYDISGNPEAARLGVQFVPLEALLQQSDFVSLHAALTPANRGLIGARELRQMKPAAYLINAARGALVDEVALVRALREGWIAGAALDTFTVEPLPVDHPFRTAPNILLTPHQASFARETGERVSSLAAQAILDVYTGIKPAYLVNPEVLQTPGLRAASLQGVVGI